jgi:glycosyltransferase involved in cell wall biosynthesis
VHVLVNAAGANVGGAITYVGGALRELVALDPRDRYTVVAPREALEPIDDLVGGPSCAAIVYDEPPGRAARRLWLDQVGIPRLLRKTGADLLYSANGLGTFVSPRPQALLVANAACFSRELEAMRRRRGQGSLPLRLRRAWTVASIRAADRAIFPTAAMAARVGRWVRLPPERTRIAPYGLSRRDLFAEGAPRPPAADAMARHRAAGGRSVLAVSTHSLHKNLETLVEAMAAVVRERANVRLVLTVDRERTGDPAAYDELFRRVRALGLGDAVANAGHVPYASLHHLYREADVFAFPSFLESFGYPMVEAMACGLPVVAADTDVNREVLGEAAVYFDTFVPERCARAILDVLARADRAGTDAGVALERAASFSWRAHATALHAAFRELTGSGRLRGEDR